MTDKNLISSVAPPTLPKMYSQSAAAVHRAIQEAREQQAQIQKAEKANKNNSAAAKRLRSDTPVRRSTRKRTRQDADLENKRSNVNEAEPEAQQPAEPPEVTALRPTAEAVRRTRSASRKARSSSTNPTPSECCFCPDPELFGGEEIKSELIGPFVNRKGQAKLFVHFDCACWAPQVFTDSKSGQLRGVYDEYCRGRKLKCSDCGGRGATIGCYVQRCKHVFHFRCLTRSGARSVERFFAAFCANHAHLGEKQSYKILMEAATIADVAEAHRRQDTTFGLDAPHSRYTQLRRRETELIFSRKFGICSHTGAFETRKVVFSHKRRRILSKTDRLSLADQPRSLLESAFDVASGRLAYMSVAGKDKTVDTLTAVEARAALASREKSSLFLLRNLRKAPLWSKEQITIVKNSASDIPKAGEGLRGKEPERQSSKPALGTGVVAETRTTEEKPDTISTIQIEPPSLTNDAGVTGSQSPDSRHSKRHRVNVVTNSDDDEGVVKAEESPSPQPLSAPLPSFKKNLPAASENFPNRTENLISDSKQDKTTPECLDSTAGTKTTVSGPHEERQNGKVSPNRKRKVALCIARDGKAQDGLVPTSRQGLAGKVKSAWETFLEEQLPKERLLRPDDPEADAMRNMARLWSLLSVEAREKYEERARQAGMSGCEPVDAEGVSGAVPEKRVVKRQKTIHKVSTAVTKIAQLPPGDPGLFAGRERTQADPFAPVGINDNGIRLGGKRQPSVSLPRKPRSGRKPSSGFELVAVDWDDLLPTRLDVDEPVWSLEHQSLAHNNEERVRRPPPRGKKI